MTNMIKNFLDLIQNNVVLSIATLLGTIFGVWGFANSRNSKKELKRFKYLFQLADQNIDKNLSEEELDDLERQKDEAQEKIENLNKIIKNDIPLEARRTILADKLKEQEASIGQSFEKYQKTKKEYEEIAQINNNIPDYILDEIENHIMPDYLIQQKKSRYMSMLTIISYVSAFLSAVPIVSIFGRFVILFSLYPLLMVYRLNLPKNKQARTKYIRNLVIGLILAILGIYNFIIIISIAADYRWAYTAWDIMVFIFLFTLPIFVIILLVLLIQKIRKNRKK